MNRKHKKINTSQASQTTRKHARRGQRASGARSNHGSPLGKHVSYAQKISSCWLPLARRLGKTVQVFDALLRSLHDIADQFQLRRHIDAHLTERHATETRRYRAGDLRNNRFLAAAVRFQHHPALKDNDRIPLPKPSSWLRHQELFNVPWNNREFLSHWASGVQTVSDSSPDLAEKLAKVQ